MLFEVSGFSVDKLLELHPFKRAAMNAIRMINRFFLPAWVSLGIIFIIFAVAETFRDFNPQVI